MQMTAAVPSRQTTHEWVRDRMRDAILAGEFTPGSRIVQTEIAEKYGVSVTPVREAMRELLGEGLIRVDPHKAATVREFVLDEALEISELRLMLEPLAVRRAAPVITDEEIARLESIQEQLDQHPDDLAWVELNHRWHIVVLEATRSPWLTEILGRLRGISRFYLAASMRASTVDRDKSNADHHAMIEAFRRRDAEAAGQIMDSHIIATADLAARFAGMKGASDVAGEPAAS